MSEASEAHGDTCQCVTCKRARKAAYMREYNRKRRARDPEFVERNRTYWREYRREWREENPGVHREVLARWRAENHEHSNEYHREYQRRLRADPEWNERRKAKRREERANWTPEEREHQAKLEHARYHRYSPKAIEVRKAWRERNKERVHAYQVIKNANRRALLKAAPGSWTWEQFQDLCHLTGNRCYYCGATPEKLTVDHAIPLSRGGSNDITNIVPACMSCNASKRAMTADEFITRLMEEG